MLLWTCTGILGTGVALFFGLLVSLLLADRSTDCDVSVAEMIDFLNAKEVQCSGISLDWLREDCAGSCALTRPHNSSGPCARLMMLIGHGPHLRTNTPPSGLHTWSDVEFPGYEAHNVFFLKNPGALVQTYQDGGLSGMHAPAMVQHYALVHNNRSAPMLDVVGYARNNLTSAALKAHIFGGLTEDNSATLLSKILEPYSRISYAPKNAKGLRSDFEAYGVGLVHNMMVQEDFLDPTVRKHYGASTRGRLVGRHAMALVGHRTSAGGKSFFLLQNWWKDKQFVEVDIDYLSACGAYIRFILTPQNEIPAGLPRTYMKYHSLDFADVTEGA